MSGLPSGTPTMRVLGVYAHPDDEVFCAGGTLAKYVAAGAEAMVVSATRGQAGQIRSARLATRHTLGQVREAELRLGCQHLGVQHTVCLDYEDGGLQKLDPLVLIGDITKMIRTFRPDVVLTFGPDGGYGHPDHVTISAATTAACRRSGESEPFPEQLAAGLEPHKPAQLYHSLFPRRHLSLLDRLVHWLTSAPKRFYGNAEFAGALLLLSEEATLLGYTRDSIDVAWYPAGFYIIEQGEAANNLYLLLSGVVETIHEGADGSQEVLGRMASGEFFGAEEMATHEPRKAHVVAVENVTCLVFSPHAPTAFVGRGQDAHITGVEPEETEESTIQQIRFLAPTVIDVSAYIPQKVAAIAAHASQFPLKQDMLPLSILEELMGREFFVRANMQPKIETELFPAAIHIAAPAEGRTERRSSPLGRVLSEF